jgi:excinuclease UvrABC ATPase subunit
MSNNKTLDQEEEYIEVVGAREHNLKNVDIRIPRNQLVVVTGLSGSGKSSLAFDTIYAEGQRRYMETFSAYARQFIGNMERPDVELITGLSPVISIEQKTSGWNPRSTVGTITEIYDLFVFYSPGQQKLLVMSVARKWFGIAKPRLLTIFYQPTRTENSPSCSSDPWTKRSLP